VSYRIGAAQKKFLCRAQLTRHPASDTKRKHTTFLSHFQITKNGLRNMDIANSIWIPEEQVPPPFQGGSSGVVEMPSKNRLGPLV
jgi:hypothetical protein